MVICLLASSYLRLGWINVGMENIPNCCFSVSWLQLSGVRGIQFEREIQAEVMNEIQELLFASTAQDVHLITILTMKCPLKNQGLQLGLNRCQSLPFFFAVLFERRRGSNGAWYALCISYSLFLYHANILFIWQMLLAEVSSKQCRSRSSHRTSRSLPYDRVQTKINRPNDTKTWLINHLKGNRLEKTLYIYIYGGSSLIQLHLSYFYWIMLLIEYSNEHEY